jgi:hypothetical protein
MCDEDFVAAAVVAEVLMDIDYRLAVAQQIGRATTRDGCCGEQECGFGEEFAARSC